MSYAGLAGLFLLPPLALLVWWVARRPGRDRLLASALAAVLLILCTVVFDSVMIAADLFRFDDAALTGLHLWLAPVEDLAWPVAAVAGLPVLSWLWSRRRGAR